MWTYGGRGKMKSYPLMIMILKSFLRGLHLINGFQTQCLLRDLEAFGGGLIKPALEMLLPTKPLRFTWGSWDNGKILNLKASLNVPPWKLTSFIPFPHLYFSSFLRSQEDWEYRLKCLIHCPTFCDQLLLNGTPGSVTLTISQRSYFHPDDYAWAIYSTLISEMKASFVFVLIFFGKDIC